MIVTPRVVSVPAVRIDKDFRSLMTTAARDRCHLKTTRGNHAFES